MYEEFYNFAVTPFENTPDPRFFFASEQHREALAAIEYTIRMRKGIVLVTGVIGSGKTTIGRTMLERCADQASIIQLAHGHTQGIELLRHVLRRLPLAFDPADDHARLLERLEQYLLAQHEHGKPVVLFVDEAQTLSDQALEQLRLFSNFDTNTDKLLQLVLIGQPELRDRIRSPRLAALRQRIVMAKQLRPLNIQETADYIRHRLSAASKDRHNIAVSFSGSAVDVIYEYAHGTPRLINVICDNCLLLGYVKEARRIGASMARHVINDMVPSLELEQPTATQSPILRLAESA
ncbi:MAG: AAA family ATPase [Phycisphaeraceae bacterium]|nr:AAA family ATPase [Phycisphaeraceae bacterium]